MSIGASFTESVNLISWLLRHRLIMQLHTYVIALISRTDPPPTTNENVDEVTKSLSGKAFQQDEEEEIASTEELFAVINPACVTDGLLARALPVEADRRRVLAHFQMSGLGTVIGGGSQMMRLFLRLLVKAPCHLEELMFVESVDRETLILCIEQFSPFLATLRLPDPVTACFAGVEWPI